MNRRLQIAIYWICKRNYVSFAELLKFLVKPTAGKIASRFISKLEEREDYLVVFFSGINSPLFWPKKYPVKDLFQVVAEIFDSSDWHFYTPSETPININDVVVDVGAAEGLFSLKTLDQCRKIFLIEPEECFYSYLNKTFSHVDDNKVCIIQAAIGGRSGKIKVEANSLASIAKYDPGGDIRMLTLDSLLMNEKKIDFIKADIEGMEMEMFQGARETIRRHRPKMAITCYHAENEYRKMIQFVRELVPDYQCRVKGITQFSGKPVMIHFWIP